MSRSCFSTAFSRRSRFSSACRSTGASLGSLASRSWLSHRVSVDRPMPRSSAISRRVRPLVSASRTASRRNSGVGLFPFPIEHLLVPQLVLSTFSGQVQASNLCVVPYGGAWSDLGGWEAVWRDSGPDARGVVTHGAATAIDCEDTLLRSEAESLEVVGIGLKDVVAVAMPDAVLVAHKDRAQDVKKAVAALKAKGAAQAETFPLDHRPWGWFESLVVGPRFQVKRIVVHPGAALSLQSHHHRAEHWIVVAGTAKVTIDGSVTLVTENQSVYVPLGAMHRLENPGKLPLTLIEVQTGSYLGEDDIVRHDDVYARGQGAKG